jgi:hypothetical protein
MFVDQEVPVAHRVSREWGSKPVPEFGARDLPSRRGAEFGRGFAAQVQAWARRHALDAALAAGADPSESPALACRAARLTRRRSREDLAAWVDEILTAAAGRPHDLSVAVHPDHDEVLGASSRLIEVAELLRSPAPVYVQGVAMLRDLLSDGGSCVYVPRRPGELIDKLDRIVGALHGEDPASARR